MRRSVIAFGLIVVGGAILAALLVPSGYSCGAHTQLVHSNVGPICRRVSLGFPDPAAVDHRFALRFGVAFLVAAVASPFLVLLSRRRYAALR
jgi:hypothetical protein